MSATPFDKIREALSEAEHSTDAAEALPHLRAVIDQASALLDEQMALAVLDGSTTLRSAGARAGLSENAVGPRLARTQALAAYAAPSGRVTAEGVRRAQYDLAHGEPAASEAPPEPMRFKPRRYTRHT